MMFRHFVRRQKCIYNVFKKNQLKRQVQRYSTKGTEESGDLHKVNDYSQISIVSENDKIYVSNSEYNYDSNNEEKFYDILVVGGGAMGSSIAYWLNQRAYNELTVAVVEKDCTYCKSSTALSVGGLRQQFSIEENIHMSLYGAEFIRNINQHLGIPGQPPIDVQFHPCGYLLLASEAGAETLQKNSKLQNSLGAKNVILTKSQLKSRFPWLNTEDIAVGCLGLEKEGWFDPWSLLIALKKRALFMGSEYINGELVALPRELISHYTLDPDNIDWNSDIDQRLHVAVIKTADGKMLNIRFSYIIIAAGAHSGEVAKLAGIGLDKFPLFVALPVEPRKRYVYCYHCPEETGINTPLTIDPSGAYFRKDGLAGHYICGISPSLEEEPPINDLDVDYEYFNTKLWHRLAHRVKAFENLKVKSAWAGFYEYNNFDKNGIIGRHCYYFNLMFATGFSGHGIQQSPAVGRAVAELIIDGNYRTIDLSKFGFDRLITMSPMREANIF